MLPSNDPCSQVSKTLRLQAVAVPLKGLYGKNGDADLFHDVFHQGRVVAASPADVPHFWGMIFAYRETDMAIQTAVKRASVAAPSFIESRLKKSSLEKMPSENVFRSKLFGGLRDKYAA